MKVVIDAKDFSIWILFWFVYDFCLVATEVFSWGSGTNYQLGTGNAHIQKLPCKVDSLSGSFIKLISAGKFHSVAVTSCGKVYTWGFGRGGRLGHPDFDIHRFMIYLCLGANEQALCYFWFYHFFRFQNCSSKKKETIDLPMLGMYYPCKPIISLLTFYFGISIFNRLLSKSNACCDNNF